MEEEEETRRVGVPGTLRVDLGTHPYRCLTGGERPGEEIRSLDGATLLVEFLY